jgi:predicted Rossmann-fold nucleotide-binding protein
MKFLPKTSLEMSIKDCVLEQQEKEEVLARISRAQDVVQNVLNGGKFDPQRHPWLKDQLEQMHAERYVLAEPTAHFSKDGEENPVVTTQHPICNRQRSGRARILRDVQERLGDTSVDTLQVFGSQVRDGDQSNLNSDNPHPYANTFLLSKANLYALDDFLGVVKAKVSAYDPEKEAHEQADIIKKPIVILNQREGGLGDSGYWDAALKEFDIKKYKDDLNITSVAEKGIAVDVLAGKLSDKRVKEIELSGSREREEVLKPGDTIFIHTTTLEKLRDYQATFRERGVTVRMLGALGAVAKSPKELSGSFEGNAEEKLRAAQVMMAQIPDEKLQDVFGLRRDQVHVMVDDSGYYVKDRRVLDTFDATDMEHLFNKDEWKAKDRPFPGVELGPLMNAANGLLAFKTRLQKAYDTIDTQESAKAAEEKAAGREYTPHLADRGVTDVACLAISQAPAFDASLKDYKTYEDKLEHFMSSNGNHGSQVHTPDFMMYADKEMSFVFPPRPKMAGDLYESKHFEVPVYDNNTRRKHTMAELEAADPTWRVRNSVRSLAARGLMSELSLSEQKARDFKAENQHMDEAKPYHVMVDGADSAGITAKLSTTAARDSTEFAIAQGVTVNDKPMASLVQMDELVKNADALVMTPQAATEDALADKYDQAFKFWSLVVARQTHPRDVDKPLVIQNPNHQFDALLDEYNALHVLGAIKEKPEILLKEVTSADASEVVDYLKEQRSERVPAANYINEGVEEGTQRRNDPNLFHTAVFCSASSENKTFQDEVFNLAHDEAIKGNGIVYGGGSNYMMGKIAAGALLAQDEIDAQAVTDPSKARTVALSGSNMPHLSDREGLPPEHMLQNNQYLNADTIYQRMEYMIDSSNAFVVAPGGAGTMQELTALLMLKSKHDEKMEDKDIILINTKGFYNAVIEHISDDERKALGIHVVENMAQGREVLAGLQQHWHEKHRDTTHGITPKAETLDGGVVCVTPTPEIRNAI